MQSLPMRDERMALLHYSQIPQHFQTNIITVNRMWRSTADTDLYDTRMTDRRENIG